MNYVEQRYSSAYDLEHFSVQETQQSLSAALNSPASVRSMSKHLSKNFSDVYQGSQTMRAFLAEHNKSLKRGQALVTSTAVNAEGESTGMVMEEGLSVSKRDHKNITTCSNCGNPNNLRICKGCKQKFFCSRSCQRVSSLHRRDINLVLTFIVRLYGRKVIGILVPAPRAIDLYTSDSNSVVVPTETVTRSYGTLYISPRKNMNL